MRGVRPGRRPGGARLGDDRRPVPPLPPPVPRGARCARTPAGVRRRLHVHAHRRCQRRPRRPAPRHAPRLGGRGAGREPPRADVPPRPPGAPRDRHRQRPRHARSVRRVPGGRQRDPASTLGLTALVAHARYVPSEAREAFADAAAAIASDPRAILLRTCHRVELYAVDEPLDGVGPLRLPAPPGRARAGSRGSPPPGTCSRSPPASTASSWARTRSSTSSASACPTATSRGPRAARCRWARRAAPRWASTRSSSACSRSRSTSAARRGPGARVRRARSRTSRSTGSCR